MDAYDLFGACATVRSFVETLTNWYIRRSRQRFWDGDRDAIDTLHTVLDVLVRVAAPLLPFVTEEIYGGLHGADRERRRRTSPTGRVPRTCPATRRSCARWTRSATCARRRCRCARPTDAACASRWRTVTVAAPDAEALRAVRRHHRRRGQRPEVVADRRRRLGGQEDAAGRPVGDRSAARRRHPARDPRRARGASGSQEDDAVVAGGHRLEPGEFVLTLQADDDSGRARRSGAVSASSCSTSTSPPSSRSRARPATSSAWCSRPGATGPGGDRPHQPADRRRRALGHSSCAPTRSSSPPRRWRSPWRSTTPAAMRPRSTSRSSRTGSAPDPVTGV